MQGHNVFLGWDISSARLSTAFPNPIYALSFLAVKFLVELCLVSHIAWISQM